MSAAEEKERAGAAAALLVEAGMRVGLGTGSTAKAFVEALAARGLKGLVCAATSEATAALARQLGLDVRDLDEIGEVELTVDGADEIGPGLALIKGGGAALLREKLVWEASARCVVIADASKPVAHLGAFPLPVEVTPFGAGLTARRVEAVVRRFGIDAQPTPRRSGAALLHTDGGNLIFDLACGRIEDPKALGPALKAVTGVVDHGLFIDLAAEALVGEASGVRRILP
jgi:ribose 5-phosphate isomerase A